MKKSFLFLSILIIISVGIKTKAAGPLPYVPGEVIVRMKTSGAVPHGFSAMSMPAEKDYVIVSTKSGQTVEEAVSELSMQSNVVFAQPNYIYRGLVTIPNDTNYSQQYHLEIIGAPKAWDITKGSVSETIAIIDSGTDSTLPDLAARIVSVPGSDIYDGDNDPSDTPSGSGHGTEVGSIAAAVTNNAYNVAGVDWTSHLAFFRVLSGEQAKGTSATIDSGIKRAIDNNATVINLSFGFIGAAVDNLIEARLAEAYSKGIIIVAAAGNDGTSPVIYPASSSYAIGVGASTSSDARVWFSNYGAATGLTGVDIMAPGFGIVTNALNGTVVSGSGTSFSAPIVSAAAALARSVRPGLTPAQFLTYLRSTAKDIGSAGYDEYTGAGRIDLYNLIRTLAARSDYGDSLPNADAKTAAMASGGRQSSQALVLSYQDSWASFYQEHNANKGVIKFYWCPDSTQHSDTAFVLTQKGNNAHSSGNLDLIFRSDRKLELRLQDSATLVSSTKLNYGQWYQVAVSYGDSGISLWLNGDSEVSSGVTGGPPVSDTLYFGAPYQLGNAQSARGRFCSLAFSTTQSELFPTALTIKIESHSTPTTEVGSAIVGWKAISSDTSDILVDIYVDTDNQDYNGTIFSSAVSNDQNEAVSLSTLELGKSYYFYAVATDSSTRYSTFPEKAFAYASAAFTNNSPPTVFVSGSTGSSGGGCILSNLPIGSDLLREFRDILMSFKIGRLMTALHYLLLGR